YNDDLENKINNEPICLKLLACKKEQKSLILKSLKHGLAKIIVTNKDYSFYETNSSLQLDLKASNIYSSFYGLPYNHDKLIGTLFI
ncbi:MAG: hypothetical protein IJT25_00860, partial [Clostridia bacterium]|nr:hypothetical protein [Clostridia bacterium]